MTKPTENAEDTKALKVIASLIITIVAENPTPKIDVQNNGMNPYMIPTLLRQLAQNFEDAIIKTRSLIE